METNSNFQTQDDGKTAAIISYLTLIGWLIAYFGMYKDKKTEFAAYHLRQTLLFGIVSMVISWVLSFITASLVTATSFYSLTYINGIVNLGLLVLWVIGLIGAIKGEKKPIPFIGEKAQEIFKNI